MRHRVYSPQPLAAGAEISVGGEEFHHAARVVRVREGEEVEVFDGNGSHASAVVAAIAPGELRLRIEHMLPSREPKTDMCLAMAIIQLDKFELVLQKATELGVRTVIPLVTERIEVRPERYRGKRGRWQTIILEAVKQSGRSTIPVLEEPQTFTAAAQRDGVRIIFDPDAAPSEMPARIDQVTVFIGPEGGWTAHELHLAREQRCLFQALGPRRLRAETAAIAALTWTAIRCGEL